MLGPPVAVEVAVVAHWDTVPGERWRLEEDLRIGVVEGSDPDDPRVFGDVKGVVPQDDGGVWVFDLLASELRHFDSAGDHTASVGRRGEGPGEFTASSCGHQGIAGEVWVETETNWHRFDRDGEFIDTFRSPAGLTCGVRTWVDSTRYLVANVTSDFETRTFRTYFTTHDWTGDGFVLVDTVQPPAVASPRTITTLDDRGEPVGEWEIPFDHTAGWRLQEDGSFIVWPGGGDYALHLVAQDGDTLRTLARAYVQVRVGRDERQTQMDRILRPGRSIDGSFEESDIPQSYPPFESARLTPDGSIWVQRVGGSGRPVHDVFSETGAYLGELGIPDSLGRMGIRHVGTSHVWGVLRDEYGVEFVVRARLMKSDSRSGLPN